MITTLFRNDHLLRQNYRYQLLVEFMRHGVYKCLQDTRKLPLPPLFKPVVTLQGLARLDEIFMGYQYTLLESATKPSATEILIPD